MKRRLRELRGRRSIGPFRSMRPPRLLRRRPPTMVLVGMAIGVTFMMVNIVRRRAMRERLRQQRADVGFMIAMHDALRRDLDRLRMYAPMIDRLHAVPKGILAGWDELYHQLLVHHRAEDEDLWPILRPRVTNTIDREEIEAMTVEHAALPRVMNALDHALRHGGEVMALTRELSDMVYDHLDHEERMVLPLIEQHMTRLEWHDFLMQERARQRTAERPRFLAWVLDDANEADMHAVNAELPPPARLAYRFLIEPRREHAHLWDPDTPLAHNGDLANSGAA